MLHQLANRLRITELITDDYIEKFWNDVLYHRENGIKGLVKEKKIYKRKQLEMIILD